MQLDIDPDLAVVGTVQIALSMGEDSLDVVYGFDGMSLDAAIGYMTVVLDRMREERKYEWATCPGCKRPWSEHYDDDEDDEEDGPELYDQDEDEDE
jgi:hypothetical protein